MTYEVEQGHQARQPYVAVRATVPIAQIGQAMGPIFQQLYESLAEANIQTAGAPWVRYLSIGEEAEFEVAAPTASEVDAPPGTMSGSIAACDYVRTVHVGPYESIGAAYKVIATWLSDHMLLMAGAPWEVYQTDPTEEPDPNKYRTAIYYPVAAMEAS